MISDNDYHKTILRVGRNENGRERDILKPSFDPTALPNLGLQYFAKRNETKRNGTLRNGTLRNGTLRNGTLRNGTLRNGTLRNGTLRIGTLRIGTLRNGTLVELTSTNPLWFLLRAKIPQMT